MTLQEFYVLAGGKYEEVLSRLMDDARIKKYLNKFVDTKDCNDMLEAIKNEDWETAFRMSHNLKGMSQNLGLTTLGRVSSELCETMRHGKPTEDNTGLVDAVMEEYNRVISAISNLE